MEPREFPVKTGRIIEHQFDKLWQNRDFLEILIANVEKSVFNNRSSGDRPSSVAEVFNKRLFSEKATRWKFQRF